LTKGRIIPKTLSTQHPDNARAPEWSRSDVTEGEAELREAFFSYHDLGCTEVMWDSEGKDVDINVVRKLLSSYPEFFHKKVIGEDIFLTYRVPNPEVEIVERKILSQTLNSIPLSADVARQVYNRDSTPVFEVILPFTTSGRQLINLDEYYRTAVAGVETMRLSGSMTVKDWMGSFSPRRIEVIPLVEDKDSLLSIDEIVTDYLKAVKVDEMRAFLARSDPALNYGVIPAVLLSKVALAKLKSVEEKSGVRIHPIIGVGSMPFRGHLSPENVPSFLKEYEGVTTVTIQSAFRYDFPLSKVRQAVATLNARLPTGSPAAVEKEDERLIRSALGKLVPAYQTRVERLAPLINSVSKYVPSRRARKLHIGLFGYSRNVKGVAMPRAIPFAAAFYSIGIPPEFVGASAIESLKDDEWKVIRKYYVNMEHDFKKVSGLVSWQTINLLKDTFKDVAVRSGMTSEDLRNGLADLMSDLSVAEDAVSVHLGPTGSANRRHENFVNNFLISYTDKSDEDARIAITEAAKIRRCIG
jgi:phosphoenolpyruvate carboxylase